MVEVGIEIKETGVIGKIKRLFGLGRKNTWVRFVEKNGMLVVEHDHEVPKVKHPKLGETQAYGASIVVGGVGGAGMTFVYKNSEFVREAIDLIQREGRGRYQIAEDPKGVLRIFGPVPPTPEEKARFLMLYAMLMSLWHDYH